VTDAELPGKGCLIQALPSDEFVKRDNHHQRPNCDDIFEFELPEINLHELLMMLHSLGLQSPRAWRYKHS
jgi:hypothetical protein